ncbi:MAG: hypothetical protein ACU84Q_17140 [Gammaproteobacteria bacterium]
MISPLIGQVWSEAREYDDEHIFLTRQWCGINIVFADEFRQRLVK